MSQPTLQAGKSVLLNNLKKPGKFMGSSQRDSFATGTVVMGINLHWWGGVAGDKGEYTDVRFELAPKPGMMQQETGPITFRTPVALKCGFRGYLKAQSKTFGIDMDFSAEPAYEWHVLNMAPFADGINSNQKIALFNKSKMSFLVYESRRIGFEAGWWKYYPPLPQAAKLGNNPQYAGYKPNQSVILAYIEQLMKVNTPEARFVRGLFGIERT